MIQIALVDDDEIMKLMLERALRGVEGIELSYFMNPNEALIAFSKNSPDLLVLDVRMPLYDGDEFLNKLSEKCSLEKIKIVVASSIIAPKAIAEKFKKYHVQFAVKDELKTTLLQVLDEYN